MNLQLEQMVSQPVSDVGSGIEDPTRNQPTDGWIAEEDLVLLEGFDGPSARACLRAKQYVLKLQKMWEETDRNGFESTKVQIQRQLRKHYPFLDSSELPF